MAAESMLGRRYSYIHYRCGEILRSFGYNNIRFEFTLRKGMARADVYGFSDDESKQAFVEIKDIQKKHAPAILTAVGELLLYQHFKPQAKLFLAVPSGSISTNEEYLSFFDKLGIKLLQIEVPVQHRKPQKAFRHTKETSY